MPIVFLRIFQNWVYFFRSWNKFHRKEERERERGLNNIQFCTLTHFLLQPFIPMLHFLLYTTNLPLRIDACALSVLVVETAVKLQTLFWALITGNSLKHGEIFQCSHFITSAIARQPNNCQTDRQIEVESWHFCFSPFFPIKSAFFLAGDWLSFAMTFSATWSLDTGVECRLWTVCR